MTIPQLRAILRLKAAENNVKLTTLLDELHITDRTIRRWLSGSSTRCLNRLNRFFQAATKHIPEGEMKVLHANVDGAEIVVLSQADYQRLIAPSTQRPTPHSRSRQILLAAQRRGTHGHN